MNKKLLSPITRIEGHLSIETRVEGGKIAEARSMGEMYRGFENIMTGRSPIDAARITQRICGVCHEVHGIAAARALKALYNVELPKNGALLIDIILALHMACDHMLHFYHLSVPDYVDFGAILSYNGSHPEYKAIKNWVKAKGPYLFTKRVKGDYIKEPKYALPLIVHYVEALELIGLGSSALATLGGKAPFCHVVFPGGITTEITEDKLAKVSDIADKIYSFVITKYIPDVMSLGKLMPQYLSIGEGYHNLICYGGFRSTGDPVFEPAVMIDDKKLPFNSGLIAEDVASSFYEGGGLTPFSKGETRPSPDKANAYSWIKSPRYNGNPMETGPLSRVYLNLHKDNRLEKRLNDLGHPKERAFSTIGRHLARAVEAAILLEFLQKAISMVNPDEPTINDIDLNAPVTGTGLGLSNAGRGELLHYVEAKNGKVLRYQCVVPSTWNFSPRDSNGRQGPAEKALENTPVAFGDGMIEAGRVVRSYDPCLACSIH